MENKRRDIVWRVYLLFFALVLFGMAIIGKSFHTQTVERGYWLSMADSLTIFPRIIEAERGNIFAEDGKLLATSVPYFEVRIDFRSEAMTDEIFKRNVDSLAIVLNSEYGKFSRKGYKERLIKNRKKGNRYYLIQRNVNYTDLQRMKKWPLFREGRYKSGMIVLQKNKRQMPFGILAQRTIGYIRDEGRYRVGIEGMYDEALSGVQGQVLVQRIAGGSYLPIKGKSAVQAIPGKDVYTTIDINMQDVAENALKKALIKHDAHHGSALLMEVKTGKIKAIANLGKHEGGFYTEQFNYAIGEATEPGSTMKLASMIALLEDGYVTIQDSINLEKGRTRFHDRIMRDAKPPKDNVVTIKTAFAKSSNVAMSKLINQHYSHQPKKYYQHLQELHLTEPVGIDLKGEPKPVVHEPKDWSGVSLPWIAVGYEVQYTPLQILTLYNSIANEGRMMKPYLVSAVREYDRTFLETSPQVIDRKICSRQTLADVKEMLEEVVISGSAQRLKSKDYSLAGKTGTARIADKNAGYSKKVYQASFVGYFPADKPEYSCIVVINSPKQKGYYGGVVAGPVVEEIADKVYANYINDNPPLKLVEEPADDASLIASVGYSDDLNTITKKLKLSKVNHDSEGEWAKRTQVDSTLIIEEFDLAEDVIPDVRGMGLRDALYVLENLGLQVRVEGMGKVKRQSVRAGTKATIGREIKLTLS